MFIEDDELRSLFQTASEEHLQKIEAGLLHLEQHPHDGTTLAELLREAHSLKGDSRMLGVKDVESLIHQFEHHLQQVQKHELTLDANLSDRLYQGLDAIKHIVHAAVTGQPSGIDTFRALAALMGADTGGGDLPPTAPPPETHPSPSPTPAQPAAIAADAEPDDTPEPPPHREALSPPLAALPEPHAHGLPALDATPAPLDTPAATAATRNPELHQSYRIETIRVSTEHLDHLITQAGELTVTKVQTAHIASGLEELLTLWEEWKAKDNNTRPVIEEKLDQRIAQLKRETQDNSARLDAIADALEDRVRTLRLLPLANVFRLFPRMVRDLAKQEKKQVNLIIEGAETAADKRILEEIKDPLIHLIRNAIDHGIETPEERDRAGKPPTATLTLRGYQTTSNVIIEVSDDGRGLHLERIRRTAVRRGLYTEAELEEMTPNQIQNLIFTPGFSTQNLITEVSGRGVGLDVVKTNVERLKGTIQVESTPGQGTTFRLQLGTTLATSNVLLVEVMGIPHALPIEYVDTSLLVEPEDIFPLDGTDAIAIDGQPVSVAHLNQLLGFSEMNAIAPSAKAGRAFPCVLLRVGEERFGIFVDQLLDTQDVVLKSQSKLLKKVRTVAGTTILGTGDVCMILHPPDLLDLVQQGLVQTPTQIVTSQITRRPLVLLAEDSITIRTQEKRILESAGYDVVTAVDGMDGLNKLKTHTFDAVISDVQMPNMTGLDLTQYIRQNPEHNELPVILVTSLASEDDRRRGAEAGADAYITKGSFNQEVLLDTLQRLI